MTSEPGNILGFDKLCETLRPVLEEKVRQSARMRAEYFRARAVGIPHAVLRRMIVDGIAHLESGRYPEIIVQGLLEEIDRLADAYEAR
ncbi:MAG: hypothetical protein KGL39_05565 [Patescibacteria group bacterium]|nr:hypothetical protein [Patescibacteria group bacterium]